MKIENILKIIDVLHNPLEELNINQINKKAKIGAGTAFRTLKLMEGKKQIFGKKKGNNIFYRLNLKNSYTQKYCELFCVKKREDFFKKNPYWLQVFSEIKNKIAEIAGCCVVFGSVLTSKKPNDLDLLIVYKRSFEKIENALRNVYSPVKISGLYMTEKEFGEKINNDVVKEILKDNLVLFGEEKYWSLLGEAVEQA